MEGGGGSWFGEAWVGLRFWLVCVAGREGSTRGRRSGLTIDLNWRGGRCDGELVVEGVAI